MYENYWLLFQVTIDIHVYSVILKDFFDFKPESNLLI